LSLAELRYTNLVIAAQAGIQEEARWRRVDSGFCDSEIAEAEPVNCFSNAP
jgi:hypothetical protein